MGLRSVRTSTRWWSRFVLVSFLARLGLAVQGIAQLLRAFARKGATTLAPARWLLGRGASLVSDLPLQYSASVGYEGTVVLNYRLGRQLGAGGFGEVYLAEHVELGRLVACKVLYREFSNNEDLVERFFREAKAVCAIGHRSILDVQNFGKMEGGEPYFLMEYFPGVDLSALIETHGALSTHWARSIFEPLAQALIAAHSKGIVHRDLKPGNVMVLVEGERIVDVKLLDFGIAKLLDTSDVMTSKTGVTMGTPTYMAPEQARDSKGVDQRADVYGFAATLYNALTGSPPFSGNLTEVIMAVQGQMPPMIRSLAPGLSVTLELAIARSLAKDPAMRPPSISAAWTEIKEGLAQQVAPTPTIASSGAVPAALVRSRPQVTTMGLASGVMPSIHARPSRLWVAVGAGLMVALTTILVAVLASQKNNTQPVVALTSEVDASATVRIDVDALAGDAGTLGHAAAVPLDATVPSDAVRASAPPTPKNTECVSGKFSNRAIRRLNESGRRRLAATAVSCRDSGALSVAEYRRVKFRITAAVKHESADREASEAARCSVGSFQAVVKDSNATPGRVRAALGRLRHCKADGNISAVDYGRVQTALIRKL